MKRIHVAYLILTLLAAIPAASVRGQSEDSAAKSLPRAEDVASIEAVINAVYDVISGPATAERDWDRFKSLFAAGARLIPTGKSPETGKTQAFVLTPDEYVSRVGNAFKEPGGFFEEEIGRKTEIYGNIAHSFSAYASFREGSEEPFMRGINSFQLVNDGEKWLIVSVFWEAERPDNPIPDKYLF